MQSTDQASGVHLLPTPILLAQYSLFEVVDVYIALQSRMKLQDTMVRSFPLINKLQKECHNEQNTPSKTIYFAGEKSSDSHTCHT